MAPNRWIPSTKTLTRPLRLLPHHHHHSSNVTISISQPCSTSLSITLLDDRIISPSQQQEIMDQVKRMLRLSKEDEKQVKEFHRLHEEAAKRGFGRLFRNPSLFEDVVKSLLLCGCRFQRSLEMAKGLCKLQKWLGKKCKWGNFPSAQELANLESEELLRNKCKLGYRAGLVMCLAKAVADGEIKLLDYELDNMQLGDEESMFQKLKTIKGFGDFVTCNVLMCMGFYDRIPIDSETIRHIKQVIHQRKECQRKNIKAMVKEIYDKYAPFQTLAYWLELVEYYENNLGKLSLLERCHYKNVTGSIITGTGNSY
ncbi:uncharacterized protein LOC112512158 [Cynara cardunculus var. scolymus]|uniref:uncharacterized protein LOC112512158 n=1 Tax=Cynara cardunculus var. scolymus TaxID=59895 RepID=UPI000D62B05D|nr:uncharacterized protein LOC112512158 [Cynara cardunculus var. scolymus]